MNILELKIKQTIENIMIVDGPDGHTDGSEIIYDFIIAIKNNKTDEWIREYEKTFDKKQNQINFFCVKKIFI